jgi:hypothetical protein
MAQNSANATRCVLVIYAPTAVAAAAFASAALASSVMLCESGFCDCRVNACAFVVAATHHSFVRG